MILTEYVENNTRIRHYSDQGMKIRQVETDAVYDDAVDYLPCKYTYVETDEPIEDFAEITDADKAEAYDILMGVSE